MSLCVKNPQEIRTPSCSKKSFDASHFDVHVELCNTHHASRVCEVVAQRTPGALVKSSIDSEARPANQNALTKMLHFSAMDVRDCMCDWALRHVKLE